LSLCRLDFGNDGRRIIDKRPNKVTERLLFWSRRAPCEEGADCELRWLPAGRLVWLMLNEYASRGVAD